MVPDRGCEARVWLIAINRRLRKMMARRQGKQPDVGADVEDGSDRMQLAEAIAVLDQEFAEFVLLRLGFRSRERKLHDIARDFHAPEIKRTTVDDAEVGPLPAIGK